MVTASAARRLAAVHPMPNADGDLLAAKRVCSLVQNAVDGFYLAAELAWPPSRAKKELHAALGIAFSRGRWNVM